MKERIKEFIDYKGISAGELATLLEVQRSNISHILNGRNKPGASLIEKMLIVFPELDARWLLTGEGNMTRGENENVPTQEKLKKVILEPVKHSSLISELKESNKQINKIVLLYNDGTFDTYDNNTK